MDKIISKNKEPAFFGKQEKLKSRKLIDLIFKEGKAIRKRTVNCLYICPSGTIDPPVQVMIAVPKRLLRKATDRNLIKRRIREAYRLNKNSLIELCRKDNKQLILAFLYQKNTIAEYKTIETETRKILTELTDKMA